VNSRRIIGAALGAGLLFIGDAQAQRIQQRREYQAQRIEQGVRSGELTRRETRRLTAREVDLRQDVHRDRIDGGGLSPAERARIEVRQDRLSRDIHKQKNDGQSRPGW
jgi:hypothetical protein